jgi:hypothetical protein
MTLSLVTKDHIRFFLRETFEFIFSAVKQPNKVMSGYVDECIIFMIRHSTFKSALSTLLSEIKDSRSKAVRERCCDYVNEILLHWELTEKDQDVIQEAIRLGLEDASLKAREISRTTYLSFRDKYPKKTEKIKSGLPNALRNRIEKFESDYDFSVANSTEESVANGNNTTSSAQTHSTYQNGVTKTPDTHIEKTELKHATSAGSNISDNSSVNDIVLPSKAFKYKEVGHVDDAVTSIQAIIRGNLARRQSSMKNFLQENIDATSPVKGRSNKSENRQSISNDEKKTSEGEPWLKGLKGSSNNKTTANIDHGRNSNTDSNSDDLPSDKGEKRLRHSLSTSGSLPSSPKSTAGNNNLSNVKSPSRENSKVISS